MSDSANSGFGKFVPGFDFLQNLAKGASQNIPQMPNLANWVAPSLNPEELEKRIEELKAVHFWLEQNSRALGATIQALEVQKMTLATLKGMNFNLGDVANAFKLKAADSVAQGVQRVTDTAESAAKTLVQCRIVRQQRGQGGDRQIRSTGPVCQAGSGRLGAGRPAAVVGVPDPAVPADCRQRHERRKPQHSDRCHEESGHRPRQGGCQGRQVHGRSRRFAPAGGAQDGTQDTVDQALTRARLSMPHPDRRAFA